MDLFLTHQSIFLYIKAWKPLSASTTFTASFRTSCHLTTAEMKSVLMIVMVCAGIQLLMMPKTAADRNQDGFVVEDQIPRTRPSYLGPIYRADPVGPAYHRRFFDPYSPEDLADLIDYANMLRKNILFMDNSMEMRAQKRGYAKRFNIAVPPVPPCSCESSKVILDLGTNYYPQYVHAKNCTEHSCPTPYHCKEKYYEITVLKERMGMDGEARMEMPESLYKAWTAQQFNVTIGCFCSWDK